MSSAFLFSRVTLALTFFFCACVLSSLPLAAAPAALKKSELSNTIVISQIYTSGGSAGATWRNDYIELFNRGTSTVNLTNWSVQYTATTGTNWNVSRLSGSILAGGYYLLQQGTSGSNGSPLVAPDAADTTNMGTFAGKVALVSVTTALNGACPTNASIIDFVGYGTTPNCYEGAGRAPVPSATTSLWRTSNGCIDTDNNNSDFSAATASPRNSASPSNSCSTHTPTRTNPPTTTTTSSDTTTDTATPTQTHVPPINTETVTSSITPNPADTPTSAVTDTVLAETTTATVTDFYTATDANTATPLATLTPMSTQTPTDTPTNTPTNSATPTLTETLTPTETPTPAPPSHLVISQIYGAGGSSGAVYQNDFIEIFNPGTVGVNLRGWSVQYASGAGASWNRTNLPNLTLAPGQYFLIQEASTGGNGSPLPAPDAIGTISMGPTAGKVALVNQTIVLNGACPSNVTIADFVGYGTTPNCAETTSTGANLAVTTAALRKNNGCLDTNHNASDFVLPLPAPNPRNSASPLNYCRATATPTDTPTQTFTLTFTPTATATPSPTVYASGIVINEFLPKPASDWNHDLLINSDDEWIELYNSNPLDVDMSGWQLDDIANGGSAPYIFPDGSVISANGFLLFYKADTNIALNDTGDQIRLLFPDSTVADALTFPDSNGDESYARVPDGSPRISADCVPSPNLPNCTALPSSTSTTTATETPFSPSPTPTATATESSFSPSPTSTVTATETSFTPSPTPTVTKTSLPLPDALDVVVNEVAWSGTQASANDEWIELKNNQPYARDLNGWTLDEGGDLHITLKGSIPAYGYYLLERTDDSTISDMPADQIYTGGLNNNGETLTLRDADANVMDTANGGGGAWAAGSSAPRCSMERRDATSADTKQNWLTNHNLTRNGLDANGNPVCGSPKNENSHLAPTPTPTLTDTPTAIGTSTFTGTPTAIGTSTLTGTPTASVTPTLTHTPTATGTPAPRNLYINEFMPDPDQDWNGNGIADENDEWIELYNANGFEVDLSSWFLDDVADGGSAPFIFARGTIISAHGYLIFSRALTHIALNNANDDVRLLKPDATLADSISYKTSDPNASWSRVPDGVNYFAAYCPPTPNASNCTIAPTPTLTPTPFASKVHLNEILSAPYKDWNHDSILDSGDEWIELYNGSTRMVDLSGWYLDDSKSGSSAYKIPDGITIAPHAYLVFYASETTIGLNNSGDTVRLIYPDHTVADKTQYAPLRTNESFGRSPSDASTWRVGCPPTPGALNCSKIVVPTPTRVFELTSLAAARALPAEAHVSILASVVAHPCELDTYGHEMSVSDGSAGMNVYLAFPSQLSCLIPRGEQLVVSGFLRDHFGMLTLYPDSNNDITRYYAPPHVIPPKTVHTGDVDESVESMLITIQGSVSNGKNGDTLWVNDGTGAVEVYANPDSHTSLGDIPRGSIVRIAGIGYQYNQNKLPNEGYYLRVRAPDDVVVLERAEKQPNAPKGRGVDIGTVSIAQVLDTRLQNYVTVGGVVTVPPGVIASRDFWIQDSNGGVHVFMSAAAGAPPKLALNTNVTVRGRVVSSFGAREIRVELPDALEIYGEGNAVQSRPTQTGHADFSKEGRLVVIDGFVSSAQGRAIYIDDGSGEVLVYLDANTKIRWGTLHRGDPAHIIGVLTRYRGAPEILPRFQSDVQFGTFLLPIAGKPDAAFLQKMRPQGRIGEYLKYTNRISARAFISIARQAHTSSPHSTDTTAPRALPQDAFTLASFFLLAASAVSGTIASHLYRRARKR